MVRGVRLLEQCVVRGVRLLEQCVVRGVRLLEQCVVRGVRLLEHGGTQNDEAEWSVNSKRCGGSENDRVSVMAASGGTKNDEGVAH